MSVWCVFVVWNFPLRVYVVPPIVAQAWNGYNYWRIIMLCQVCIMKTMRLLKKALMLIALIGIAVATWFEARLLQNIFRVTGKNATEDVSVRKPSTTLIFFAEGPAIVQHFPDRYYISSSYPVSLQGSGHSFQLPFQLTYASLHSSMFTL